MTVYYRKFKFKELPDSRKLRELIEQIADRTNSHAVIFNMYTSIKGLGYKMTTSARMSGFFRSEDESILIKIKTNSVPLPDNYLVTPPFEHDSFYAIKFYVAPSEPGSRKTSNKCRTSRAYLDTLVDALMTTGYQMQELVERRVGPARVVFDDLKV
jgi:hypothetical protein